MKLLDDFKAHFGTYHLEICILQRVNFKFHLNVPVPWSQRLSFILYWQILRREPLLLFFFVGTKR